MRTRFECLAMQLRGAAAGLMLLVPGATPAQVATPPVAAAASAPAAAAMLFAVEIRTGPAWDPARPPQEQAHFRAHSQHLHRLRQQGVLLVGARYADKGWLVLRAASPDDAHALMKDDPSMQAGVFGYELHALRVFYGGTLPGPVRP